MTFRFRVAALCMLAVVACSRAPRAVIGPSVPEAPRNEPRNGLEVVGWMRFAHPSRQLRTLSFSLSRERVADSSASAAVGYARLPGAMRTEALSGDAVSLVRDRHRIALFRNGKRIGTAKGVDLRALLAFDVFAESIDTTIMWLDSAHVRFGLARQTDWNGRRAWVVGASAGDDTSAQFWVDARSWRLLRVIQREPENPRLLSDTRYLNYDELLDIPVPTRIEIWRGGALVEQHTLSEFVVNPVLPSRAFDLSRWRRITRPTSAAR
jgi:hypothetical protein